MRGHYAASGDRRKIGHITPSSNTVLEPLTGLLSRDFDDRLSHHFTRIKVESISLEARHTGQFAPQAMLAAADLLSDAGADVILWNGTSGAWNGLDADRELCALISDQTGIASSTTSMAGLEVMAGAGLERCALAVPYTDDVTARIAEVYGQEGIQVVGSANAGVHRNRDMAFVSEDTVRGLLRDADSPDADCILLICTGVAGAQLVEEMEAELGKPILDSVAVTFWKALTMLGIEPRLDGWGSLLAGTGLARAG